MIFQFRKDEVKQNRIEFSIDEVHKNWIVDRNKSISIDFHPVVIIVGIVLYQRKWIDRVFDLNKMRIAFSACQLIEMMSGNGNANTKRNWQVIKKGEKKLLRDHLYRMSCQCKSSSSSVVLLITLFTLHVHVWQSLRSRMSAVCYLFLIS